MFSETSVVEHFQTQSFNQPSHPHTAHSKLNYFTKTYKWKRCGSVIGLIITEVFYAWDCRWYLVTVPPSAAFFLLFCKAMHQRSSPLWIPFSPELSLLMGAGGTSQGDSLQEQHLFCHHEWHPCFFSLVRLCCQTFRDSSFLPGYLKSPGIEKLLLADIYCIFSPLGNTA